MDNKEKENDQKSMNINSICVDVENLALSRFSVDADKNGMGIQKSDNIKKDMASTSELPGNMDSQRIRQKSSIPLITLKMVPLLFCFFCIAILWMKFDQKCGKFEKEISSILKENNKLWAENEEMNKLVEKLMENVEKLEEKMEEKEIEMEEMGKTIEGLEGNSMANIDAIEELNKKLEKSTKEFGNLEAKMVENEGKMAKEIGGLEKAIKKMKDGLAEIDEELKGIKEKMDDIRNGTMKELKKQIYGLKLEMGMKIGILQNSLKELIADNKEWTWDLISKMDGEMCKMRKQIVGLKEEFAKLAEEKRRILAQQQNGQQQGPKNGVTKNQAISMNRGKVKAHGTKEVVQNARKFKNSRGSFESFSSHMRQNVVVYG